MTIAMFMLFGWFISRFAKNNMPRLLWSGLGIYFIYHAYILSPLAFLGLGLLLPHFRFLYRWVNEVINTLKLLTHNTYYFFLTIYFKVRYYVMWFIYIYFEIKGFFSNIKNKNAYEKYYKHKGYDYQEPKREQKEKYSYEEQRQEKFYEDAKQQEPRDDSRYEKYKQFYSENDYIVLGVSPNNDYKTIKKAYKELINKYHTDVNQHLSLDELDIYKEITQNLNSAWETVARLKK